METVNKYHRFDSALSITNWINENKKVSCQEYVEKKLAGKLLYITRNWTEIFGAMTNNWIKKSLVRFIQLKNLSYEANQFNKYFALLEYIEVAVKRALDNVYSIYMSYDYSSFVSTEDYRKENMSCKQKHKKKVPCVLLKQRSASHSIVRRSSPIANGKYPKLLACMLEKTRKSMSKISKYFVQSTSSSFFIKEKYNSLYKIDDRYLISRLKKQKICKTSFKQMKTPYVKNYYQNVQRRNDWQDERGELFKNISKINEHSYEKLGEIMNKNYEIEYGAKRSSGVAINQLNSEDYSPTSTSPQRSHYSHKNNTYHLSQHKIYLTPIDCNARSAIPSAGVKDKKILSCYLKPQAIVKSSHSKVEKKQLPIFQEDNNDSEVVSTNSKDEEFWALQNRKEEVQCLEQNQAICLHKLVYVSSKVVLPISKTFLSVFKSKYHKWCEYNDIYSCESFSEIVPANAIPSYNEFIVQSLQKMEKIIDLNCSADRKYLICMYISACIDCLNSIVLEQPKEVLNREQYLKKYIARLLSVFNHL